MQNATHLSEKTKASFRIPTDLSVEKVALMSSSLTQLLAAIGVAALRKAGIDVTIGLRISAARILNSEYLRSVVISNAPGPGPLYQLLF